MSDILMNIRVDLVECPHGVKALAVKGEVISANKCCGKFKGIFNWKVSKVRLLELCGDICA